VLRLRRGEAGLASLLEGYSAGRPFAVLSDAFPAGYLPRPSVPDWVLGREVDPARRKEEKRLQWLPADQADRPLPAWIDGAVELPLALRPRSTVVTRNTINRLTGTTGAGLFAPRQSDYFAYPDGATLDLLAVVDESRFGLDELHQALQDVGASGYGRDASTGLGKFAVEQPQAHRWPAHSRTAITLAPCAPVPADLEASECFYLPVTRFGRHGGTAAWTGEAGPFKRPILLARTGAMLTCKSGSAPEFHGRGLGGESQPISGVIPQTVHQGYAPLVPAAADLRTEER
jgi:CRISPR-associated protein Csm4